MCSIRRTLAAALLLALAACGGKHNTTDGFDGGSSSYALTLVGSANYTVHPTDKRTLQVLLSQDQVGPSPTPTSTSSSRTATPPARRSTSRTSPPTPAASAPSTSAPAPPPASPPSRSSPARRTTGRDPVAFSFNVIPVRKLLQIVGTATTHVAADGASATTTMGVNASVGLKVRELDLDTGAAIAKDSITFTLPPAAVTAGSPYWSTGTASTVATTSAGGEAQAFILTKSTTGGPWLVTAQSSGGGAGVTFSVTVQNSTGSSCTTNSQCPAGQVCAGNPPTCQPGNTGTGCDNGSDNPCPFGYLCIGGVCTPPNGTTCDPSAPNCTSGYCCDSGSLSCIPECASPCAAGSHCAAGATCGTGTCQSDTTVPDITGVWLTKHSYSIKDALPTALQDIFYAIRVIDQALLGKLTITGIPWIDKIINAIVSQLLQQYLPDWLQQVIHISDDLVTILSDLRSEGSMRLVPNARPGARQRHRGVDQPRLLLAAALQREHRRRPLRAARLRPHGHRHHRLGEPWQTGQCKGQDAARPSASRRSRSPPQWSRWRAPPRRRTSSTSTSARSTSRWARCCWSSSTPSSRW